MLKHFVFVVIVLSASVTWITVLLIEKCLATGSGDQRGKKEEADEENDQDKSKVMATEEVVPENDQSEVHDTCSALGHCLCALGLCFFAPCTSSCCRFARGENPYSFTFYLSNGFCFFWRGFQLRFLTAFGAFSSGLVSLLSAPVQNEDKRFFALKSSLMAIWVPCVVGDKPHTFLVTALVSRLVRSLALVATLLLYKFKFPEFLQKRTILLFCAPRDTLTSLGIYATNIYSGSECIQFCKNETTDCLDHRFRACEDDSFFFAILLSVLAFSSVLSLLATLRLKQLGRSPQICTVCNSVTLKNQK